MPELLAFWRAAPWRAGLLLLSLVLIMALAVVNLRLLRSSLWFTPPGVQTQGEFATLGMRNPEGRFLPVSLHDLRKLDDLGFRERWSAYAEDGAVLGLGERSWPETTVALASDGFFRFLDIPLALGESFSAERDGVVLSHRFWREQLQARPDVLGQLLKVKQAGLPILGVAAPEFRGLGSGKEPAAYLSVRHAKSVYDIRLPLPPEALDGALTAIVQGAPMHYGIVRLAHGDERERLAKAWSVRASESIKVPVVMGGMASEMDFGFDTRDHRPAVLAGVDLTPEESAVVGRYLRLLLVQTGILAGLAALNLGMFWFARLNERRHEIGVRVALGAALPRLLRDFAAESLPFFALAALLGLPLAHGLFAGLLGLEPFAGYFGGRHVELGLADLGPGLAALAAIALLAALAPLALVRRTALRVRVLGGSRSAGLLRGGLVLLQWSLVLAVAAVALMALLSGQRLAEAPWGGTHDAYVLDAVDQAELPVLAQALRLGAGELPRLARPPLRTLSLRDGFRLPALDPSGRVFQLYRNEGNVQALEALGLPLLAGRLFSPASQGEVVVSAALARALGVAPERLVGQSLATPERMAAMTGTGQLTIVGVVADLRYAALHGEPELVFYDSDKGQFAFRFGAVLLPPELGPRLPGAIRELAGDHPALARKLAEAKTLGQIRDGQTRTERVLAACTLGLSLLALGLLLVGLLSDARFLLAQRGRELALRAALGASLEGCVLALTGPRLALAAGAVLLAGLGLYLGRRLWLAYFPLLARDDGFAVAAGGLVCLALFVLLLAGMCWQRLRTMALAQLLRLER